MRACLPGEHAVEDSGDRFAACCSKKLTEFRNGFIVRPLPSFLARMTHPHVILLLLPLLLPHVSPTNTTIDPAAPDLPFDGHGGKKRRPNDREAFGVCHNMVPPPAPTRLLLLRLPRLELLLPLLDGPHAHSHGALSFPTSSPLKASPISTSCVSRAVCGGTHAH